MTVIYLLSLPLGWKSYRDYERAARRTGQWRRPMSRHPVRARRLYQRPPSRIRTTGPARLN